MEYPPWQSSEERSGKYTPRKPWDEPLYQLIYQYREELEYKWDELFFEKYGHLRPEVIDAFDRFLNCGILRHGCARAQCQKCNNSILIAFSCKRRGLCPSCSAKRALLFAENMHENVLLPYPHRHLTFTIPKRLRVYFRYDRKLLSQLYKAAWDAIREIIQSEFPDGTPGCVMALHTWGNLLNWHPHLHCIALNGAMSPDGMFLPIDSIDTELLSEYFAENVYSFLLKAELISLETASNMKSWQHSGFHVHAAKEIDAYDENARLYLARYLKKSPLTNERLRINNNGIVPVVEYHYGKNENRITKTFSPLEFLAELSLHTPRVFEQTYRMYGEYSPRTRGKRPREERHRQFIENNYQELEYEPPPRGVSANWARCIKRVILWHVRDAGIRWKSLPLYKTVKKIKR